MNLCTRSFFQFQSPVYKYGKLQLSVVIFLLVAVGSSLDAKDTTVEIGFGSAAAHSAAPKWDARGLGPLPWQGIACLDMSDDAHSIVVGTIATQGDPNLLQLDGDGKIIGQHTAGQRWVNEAGISNDGRFVASLCATPEGTSGDVPRLYGFFKGKEVNQVGDNFNLANFRPEWCLWHYGEHSNHLPRIFAQAGKRLVVAGDQEIDWISSGDSPSDERAQIGPGLTTAIAASSGGVAVVGRYPLGFSYTPGEAAQHAQELAAISNRAADGNIATNNARPAFQNLVVVKPDRLKPIVWSRPASNDVAPSAAPEEGNYGPAAPPHEDLKFQAPLAVAIDHAGQKIAVADYEGWQRVFHPRDGSQDIPFGMRFMPSRPTIHIYDLQGKVIRRIGPENFSEAFWCDLSFSVDGQKLLVSPHNWTSRGLGGEPILPADENARSLYVVDLASGDLKPIHFPDVISSADMAADDTMAVGCWNHHVYLLDKTGHSIANLPAGIDVGAASLVRAAKNGNSRFAVATTTGVVQMLDSTGKQLWSTNLNEKVRPGDKPWTKNQKADPIAPGIWRTNGGRAHSDLGSQILVEAPEGLILIDPNAGESFEQNWARMVGAGFDPMKIKYVLITHEHGDHAPGARLWRVITGARVVAGATTAYDLQHLTPAGTGYGFHPPTPVDIPISTDKVLQLAGLTVRAICLPGHTYGSMGYAFQKNDRTYIATGDLIMGGGVLGYDGSLDFSAEDVLRSLHKVAWVHPDLILGGHGIGPADEFIAKGIEAGEETGWSHVTPPSPNPFCRFTQKNYLIVAWRERIAAAAYGDIDGDGHPDVAVLVPQGKGSVVKIYLNHNGNFAAAADAEIPLPDLEHGSRLRLVHLGKSGAADFFVASEERAVVLLAQAEPLKYKAAPLEVTRASEARVSMFPGDSRPGLLIGARFVDSFYTARQQKGETFQVRQANRSIPRYLGCQFTDLHRDGRQDLITSNGDIFLGRPDGSPSDVRAFHLTPPPSESQIWTYVAAADFEHRGLTDIALLANSPAGAIVWLYRNTRDPKAPFPKEPSVRFTIPEAEVNRDGPTIADWNGDGTPDLILSKRGNEGGAFILAGSASDGLNPKRVESVKLDYIPYYDARFGIADFKGDGRMGLAGFGRSPTGTMGVYIWLQETAAKEK